MRSLLLLEDSRGPNAAFCISKRKAIRWRKLSKAEYKLLYALKNMIKLVKQATCLDCGIASNLTFDHLRSKQFGIAQVGTIILVTRRQLIQELNKCQLVCRTCHNFREIERSWQQNNKFRLILFRRKRAAAPILGQVCRIFRALI